MAAPEGNQFWKLRSKHGRDKLFETPELLWEAACEYFEWCEENPLIEVDFKTVDKELERIELPKMRAFTLHGICSYLGCNTAYFRTFKSQERAQKEDFSTVIATIEETIYNQKFSGAAAGFLNANIIARDLGLSDKVENHLSGGITWNEQKTYVSPEGPMETKSDLPPHLQKMLKTKSGDIPQ